MGLENLPLPGFEPWTVQRIASRYTNYVILAAHVHNLAIVMLDGQLLGLIAPLASEMKVITQKDTYRMTASILKTRVNTVP